MPPPATPLLTNMGLVASERFRPISVSIRRINHKSLGTGALLRRGGPFATDHTRTCHTPIRLSSSEVYRGHPSWRILFYESPDALSSLNRVLRYGYVLRYVFSKLPAKRRYIREVVLVFLVLVAIDWSYRYEHLVHGQIYRYQLSTTPVARSRRHGGGIAPRSRCCGTSA
jgi:hypothetical protein